ncbi:hypothetical protein C1H76_7970 [Elsinoe australis]|uniref:Uncharacterized protein n=1 Tax=Elsinoe australis TaxID=40998 RepID=A0A4V6DTJ5_9PEZI|nr:hypothetical protein C1H76_7970 [Elsinoe australis]
MVAYSVLAVGLLGAQGAVASLKSDGSAMAKLMEAKEADWKAAADKGTFLISKFLKKVTSFQPCINGKAGRGVNSTYTCNNVNLHGFISHDELGTSTTAADAIRGNDVWGWTSPDGREFGLVGQVDGTAFVELNTRTGTLDYLGRLNTQTVSASWRDIKVIGHYAYIGSEAAGHGLQIFDLNKLLDIKKWWNPFWQPVVFDKIKDISLFTGFGATHNIVAFPERNLIFGVGGREGANARNTTCAGGPFAVDVSDPLKPFSPGCIGQDGYTHDAQCVVYNGPSEKYLGKDICFGYNEDSLTVYDVTDIKAPLVVSSTPYFGSRYSHQGWLIDSTDHTFLLLDDELDERDGTVGPATNKRTTTYIWNVTNLEAPVNSGFYQSPKRSIDHNQYTREGLTYQSNYASGLRIVDVSGVPIDPTGGNMKETGFFDVYPEDDAGEGEVAFLGTWSNYPYFNSRYILVNSIERGIFSVKYTGRKAAF